MGLHSTFPISLFLFVCNHRYSKQFLLYSPEFDNSRNKKVRLVRADDKFYQNDWILKDTHNASSIVPKISQFHVGNDFS